MCTSYRYLVTAFVVGFLFAQASLAQETITIDVPNGGEVWNVGSTRYIRWHSNNVTHPVRMDLNCVSGPQVLGSIITVSTPNDGSHEWIVPHVLSNECYIQIFDAVDGVPDDVSDKSFSIVGPTVGSITVDVPNGGEIWNSGSKRYIRWHSANLSGSVRIEYSIDGGSTYKNIAASTSNDGTHEWTVPAEATSNALVRVSSAATGTPSDVSNAPFDIIVPASSIEVDVPDGGEVWNAGSQRIIVWRSINFTGPVDIEFSTNGGGSYSDVVLSTANDGSYTWTVPNTPTGNALIRISGAASGIPSDVSSGVFTITSGTGSPSVTVDVPNGGESWSGGSSRLIRWHSNNFSDPVRIEYSTNGGAAYSSVVGSTANDGSYEWAVPNTATTNALVRISGAATGSPSDVSNAVFSITAAGPAASITVSSPNGGENWQVGTSHPIRWNAEGFSDPVRIDYSTDGGGTFRAIVGSTQNDGEYTWSVPDAPTSTALVKVSDAADGHPFDVSDGMFTISRSPVEGITVSSPNGGEIWNVGTVQTILWASSNFADPVHIEFSTDGGGTYSTIVASTSNSGSYEWTIPDAPSERGRVRVSDAADGSPVDASDADFAIVRESSAVELVVTQTGNEGSGSLHNVLELALGLEHPETIRFAIPESDPGYDAEIGAWVITPTAELPAIEKNGLRIDGFSQNEFLGRDANPVGPEIVIDGREAGEGVNGFLIRSHGVEILGLAFTHFGGAGIIFSGVESGFVYGNHLGIAADGATAAGNTIGVILADGTKSVHVVGSEEHRNVISGNLDAGIVLTGGATRNAFYGNHIGLDVSGLSLAGNSGPGLLIEADSDSNDVFDNRIGGNGVGILLIGSDANTVISNQIGTDETWEHELGNEGGGVVLTGGAQDNLLADNMIAYNRAMGVHVDGEETIRNTLSRNAISANGGAGIRNDFGGNRLLDAPFLEELTEEMVAGSAGPGQVIELFVDNDNEGRFFLGAIDTDESGRFAFPFREPVPAAFPNVTATATDAEGNTSSFSDPARATDSEDAGELPAAVSLSQNYPNPFRDRTTFSFELPEGSHVVVDVINVLGERVATLVDQRMPAGAHVLRWPNDRFSAGLPSGLYICRLRVANSSIHRRMLKVR